MGLNTISTTNLFDTFTKTLYVGYDNVALSFNFTGDSLSNCNAMVIGPINDLTVRLVKSFLHLVQSPFRIFALSESLSEVVLFLLEQLRLAAHCFGPMREGVDDTKLSWEVMVTIPTVSTGLYVWVSCTKWWIGYHQASGLTMVSKKGMDPSSLLSSTVNLMAASTLLMCWRKSCLLTSLWMTKVSFKNLHQNLGRCGAVLRAFCSKIL